VGALLAASTGIVGATVVAMGMIALPAMLRNGYNPRLAAGTVCTAGTLGQIIPPSTLLIILAEVMSSAFQQAQFRQGRFSIETISVGQTFAAALMPGILLVVIYIVYVLGRAWLIPGDAPAMRERTQRVSTTQVLGATAPPVLLIVAVLGAIMGGIASPNEAASVGAVGAILLAGYRRGASRGLILAGAAALLALAVAAGMAPVRLQRSDTGLAQYLMATAYGGLGLVGVAAIASALWALARERLVKPALAQTMIVTAMIFATILMASFFSLVFVGLGGEHRVAAILDALPGGATGALIFAMLFVFVLGFFLDFVEISVILLPLLIPPLIMMGHDPIWLAVLIAVNLQTSFLTPPFGFALFYLRGGAPAIVRTVQIYRGVLPFIGLQIAALGIVAATPPLVNYLPNRVSYLAETSPPPRNPRLGVCVQDYMMEGLADASGALRTTLAEGPRIDLSALPAPLAAKVGGALGAGAELAGLREDRKSVV